MIYYTERSFTHRRFISRFFRKYARAGTFGNMLDNRYIVDWMQSSPIESRFRGNAGPVHFFKQLKRTSLKTYFTEHTSKGIMPYTVRLIALPLQQFSLDFLVLKSSPAYQQQQHILATRLLLQCYYYSKTLKWNLSAPQIGCRGTIHCCKCKHSVFVFQRNCCIGNYLLHRSLECIVVCVCLHFFAKIVLLRANL